MRKGRFFHIPETPGDVDELRRRAVRLDAATLPSWLDASDAPLYGCVDEIDATPLSEGERRTLLEETRALEAAGLVVQGSGAAQKTWRVYVPAQRDYQEWSIGVLTGPSVMALGPPVGVVNPVLAREDVTDAAALFVADPFMVRSAGVWYMFFELMNWRSNKGEIGLATSQDGLRWRYRQRVLIEPFHLSYPYVFEDQGEFFLIPESRQSGVIRLYRATAFPMQWSFSSTLVEGNDLLDPSVFRREGRWWMFAGRGHDALLLFTADALAGPWRAHPYNPIVEGDPHAARPAGRVIEVDGRLLRFAQNCDPAYGLDVRVFEIVELTPESYREIAVAAAPILQGSKAGWNACGMHHVDAHRLAGGGFLACVDGWSS